MLCWNYSENSKILFTKFIKLVHLNIHWKPYQLHLLFRKDSVIIDENFKIFEYAYDNIVNNKML